MEERANGSLADGSLADGSLADGPLADGPLADGPLADGAVKVAKVAEGTDGVPSSPHKEKQSFCLLV